MQNWFDVSPEKLLERRRFGEFATLLLAHRGDPRLSSFQERLLLRLAQVMRHTDGLLDLNELQLGYLHRMGIMLEKPVAETDQPPELYYTIMDDDDDATLRGWENIGPYER
ncbi:unnamed protein product [Sphagnum tenellum]